ncbi:MAG: DUF4340 domain-containing protein, partial [Clostridiales bacterium]|nr:DUF4340 domain-containing protein [Clostridiales bacterium]
MSRKTQRKFSLSIAAVVIAIMAGVYFLQIRQHDEPTEERTSYIVNLITRNEDEVEWIVDFNSQHIIPYFDEIERIQWRFFRFEYRCSPQRMREKVSFAWNLTAVGIAHENSAGINLADFGLDSSANAFQVHYHDEGSHVLHLGSQTSDLQHYFLMIDDDPAIYLINASD